MIRTLTRLENAAILLLCLVSYAYTNGATNFGIPYSILLFMAPDLSLLGKLVNDRVGAICYNTVHNYLLPAMLLLAAMAFVYSLSQFNHYLLLNLGLLFAAHVAMDRMLGLGMKYPGTKETHVQRI